MGYYIRDSISTPPLSWEAGAGAGTGTGVGVYNHNLLDMIPVNKTLFWLRPYTKYNTLYYDSVTGSDSDSESTSSSLLDGMILRRCN